MNDWLIVNADIVNEGRRFPGDVRIRDGRIDAVAPSLPGRAGERTFDAAGRLLIPGLQQAGGDQRRLLHGPRRGRQEARGRPPPFL